MALSAAAYASVIGGSAELNPVRTQPHNAVSGREASVQRIIVKLRAPFSELFSRFERFVPGELPPLTCMRFFYHPMRKEIFWIMFLPKLCCRRSRISLRR